MNRKPIFDEVRVLLGRGFRQSEVDALDAAITRAEGALPACTRPDSTGTQPSRSLPTKFALGQDGTKLIKKWETCAKLRADGKYEAYPDPGSSNGKPWTIGWGSTGPDISRGTIWTQEQCDADFDREIVSYVAEVEQAIGNALTSQAQFDALVSFHYNTGKIGRATLTHLHRQGDYGRARQEFGKWIYNDRRVMQGLVNRRSEEAALYGS